MEKKDFINKISTIANKYKDNLLNNDILFLYGSKENPYFFISSFAASNFLHLTGVQLTYIGKIKSNKLFFEACINNKLKKDDFNLGPETDLKLSVLPLLMDIHHSARFVGDYNNIKINLFTQKIATTQSEVGCLGFKQTSGFYYVPNTVLNEDIRNVTFSPQFKVLAILRKNKKDQLYSELCYMPKGININQIHFPDEIKNRILKELI